MKIIRKTLSILLIVAMLCPMLASCGNKFGTPIMKLLLGGDGARVNKDVERDIYGVYS